MSMKNTLADILSEKKDDTYTLSPNDPVSAAIEKMSSHNIGALVIVGDAGKVAGIFSERDLLNRVAAARRDPDSTPVSDVMTHHPECVELSMTVEQAMHEVTEKRIRHLPLVLDGKLQGLISSGDLTAWAISAQQTEIEKLTRKLKSAAARNRALLALVIGFVALVVIGFLTRN